jgi:ACS family hexuronate transporter-like MFS transporter
LEIETPKRSVIFSKHLSWMLLIQTVTAMAYYGYIPLIPMIERDFMLNKTEIGWMTSFIFIGSSIIAIPSGILVDRLGSRRVLLFFTCCLVGVLSCFSIVNNFWMLLMLLLLIGVCYGSVTPGTNKHIMTHFSAQNRGTIMGFKQMGVPLGSALGTITLPLIAYQYNWRASMVALAALTLILAFIYYKTIEPENIESASKNTILKDLTAVLKNKALIHTICIIFFFIWVQLSVMTYLVVYFIQDKLMSFALATASLVFLQIGGILGRAFWGWVNDNWMNRDRSKIIGVIGLLSGLLLTLMIVLPIQYSLIVVYSLVFLLGVTTQGWNGIFVVMISEVVPKQYVGLASGVGLSVVYLGAIFGTPLSGKLIDLQQSYTFMWGICAGVILIIGLSLFIKPIKINNNTEELLK